MKKINIKPLGDRVVVEPAMAEQKTASGIIIPDSAKEKPSQGTVVAVSEADEDRTPKVNVGDRILYGKFTGTEIEVDGNSYLIMSEADILAII
jgi:chaperonin GroES